MIMASKFSPKFWGGIETHLNTPAWVIPHFDRKHVYGDDVSVELSSRFIEVVSMFHLLFKYFGT